MLIRSTTVEREKIRYGRMDGLYEKKERIKRREKEKTKGLKAREKREG